MFVCKANWSDIFAVASFMHLFQVGYLHLCLEKLIIGHDSFQPYMEMKEMWTEPSSDLYF